MSFSEEDGELLEVLSRGGYGVRKIVAQGKHPGPLLLSPLSHK